MDCFDRTDNRVVHPDLYLAALERTEKMQPMVLMPYLPGPESSVDMLVEKAKSLQLWHAVKKAAYSTFTNRVPPLNWLNPVRS